MVAFIFLPPLTPSPLPLRDFPHKGEEKGKKRLGEPERETVLRVYFKNNFLQL